MESVQDCNHRLLLLTSLSYEKMDPSKSKAFRYVFILTCVTLTSICLFAHGAAGSASGRWVCDQAGRWLLAPENPQSIIALAPNITELIYTLGEEHRLAGVAQQSDYPVAAKSLPTIGSYIHPDIEKIVALKPDLCIAINDGNPRDIISRLESLGTPVYVINPRDLDGIMRSLLEIGELLGTGRKAELAVDGMRARIERVKVLAARTASRPKVFFQIGAAPLVSVGSRTFADELITAAGGENISRGSAAYPRFTKEQVLVLQPDVIIITSMTKGENFDRVRSEWNEWPSLPAVRNGRVYVVDSDLFDRPSVRLVDALELLVRIIHPELCHTD
jgi:iron complex transport system substrate-binding protein